MTGLVDLCENTGQSQIKEITMNSELLILRHGKSDWSAGTDDFHRPLKERGELGAQRMGQWMQQQGLIPDHVVSSPAERAITTAEKACKAMGLDTRKIIRDQRVYGAYEDELVAVLRECPEQARRVMIVGHNPGLEDLVVHLADTPPPLPEDGKLVPTATLARLQINCGWERLGQGCAKVLSITRPAELPPHFTGADGNRVGNRPEYYYTQSSIIPYRVREGRPEILVISSRKGKHWIVPKGIVEPDLSPADSAAKEALEEAGIEGTVSGAPIGRYTYEKWGGTCNVDVYPMEVTRVLPVEEWLENFREREWVSPDAAMNRLKHQELRPMVLELASRLKED